MDRNAHGSSPCILIVEDDAAVRRSLQLLLRSKGLEVRAHGSATNALADPMTIEAACLVADLKMPDIDGIELLRTLRQRGWKGSAILISGFMTDVLEAQARMAGYAGILRKPVADSLLVAKIQELVAQYV
jgi:FixJ family two-component response regulator